MDKEKYSELFKNIWEKTLPYLGVITIEGIFRRLIKKREIQYPFLSKIALSERGFDFSLIQEENIKEGLNSIILDFYKFLEEMTGSLVISEIEGLIKDYEVL